MGRSSAGEKEEPGGEKWFGVLYLNQSICQSSTFLQRNKVEEEECEEVEERRGEENRKEQEGKPQ